MSKHIVLIEDEPDILESTTLLLENEGFRVSGFKAFTTLEEMVALQPDCFLLDENLPIISGHIICILFKSKPVTREIPVVLISANPAIKQKAAIGEADAYIGKPFEIQELVDVLTRVMA
ncbi:response regulator [Mucilaginibacter sp. P25]|uniref:Response regulator transcription factor n=2 Tax=Mucilaginibacter TaxID=423349 RepID=A0AAE6JED3_9SPHI|nr:MULTISPECIES: response regulator [Mucilaginibacter]QEM03856.1 response regulator transcription factor [Mucilaginibacter rubeus]QEM16467.1 response regulator transcription factor [Mucilaginibacter gossypii]QTE38740.1 response regulator [Mucilaginibacter gossypii]QTE40767.1 response regulator transcription factor [Mucilaginibacter rubeus]QTE47369.1 response regulator transcription factor [Mucilaginibacter rubeus]